jgi:hypothetical protein
VQASAGYAISGNTCSVSLAATCTFSVTFTPPAKGSDHRHADIYRQHDEQQAGCESNGDGQLASRGYRGYGRNRTLSCHAAACPRTEPLLRGFDRNESIMMAA